MVRRVQRATGQPFLGFSRYPECLGTRPIRLTGGSPGASPQSNQGFRSVRRRYRLSSGGRYAKNLPEVAELLVARAIGRDLGAWEGCMVQLLALVALLAIVYWVFVSGLFTAIMRPLVDWYVHQIHFGPAPSPSP
jgi:hypothetical protein